MAKATSGPIGTVRLKRYKTAKAMRNKPNRVKRKMRKGQGKP